MSNVQTPNYLIVEEEIVDITKVSNWEFTSNFAKEVVLNPEKFKDKDTYPIDILVNSIKIKGFIPNFPDVTYHGDSLGYLPSALVLERHNDTYITSGGYHRLCAAKLVNLNMIRCYVFKRVNCSQKQIDAFKKIISFMNQYGNCKYQSWKFADDDYNIQFTGRDDSDKIFEKFELPTSTFAGRTVLDIACNTGYFAIRCGLLGATEIAGFDITPECIESANNIANAYGLNCKYDFRISEFWDYPFDKTYDIVFCNQSMYHFNSKHRSKCSGSIDDMLDKISRITGRILLMYTFLDINDPPSKDGGYYPSSSQLEHDLMKRGFNKVIIKNVYGNKKHVIAIKNYKNLVQDENILRFNS